uniref:Putative secreted protein n=1 Tax=Anopheles darlingi TaxID=43151 RepID=A0A2M4D943_ANODA
MWPGGAPLFHTLIFAGVRLAVLSRSGDTVHLLQRISRNSHNSLITLLHSTLESRGSRQCRKEAFRHGLPCSRTTC